MKEDKEYYSVVEFAKIFNFSPLTIRNYIRNGDIFAIRMGSRPKSPYRIHRGQIDRLHAIQNKNK